MLIKWIAILLASKALITKAEPPVNSYLPPTTNGGRPSQEYGAPGFEGGRGFGSNNPRQGGGSIGFGTNRGQAVGANDISQFERPPQNQFGSFNEPSASYGAPNDGIGQRQGGRGRDFQRPDSQYGTPGRQDQDREANFVRKGGSSDFGSQQGIGVLGSRSLDTQYGAPNQIGSSLTPLGLDRASNQGRQGGSRGLGDGSRSETPDTQYGAPNQQPGSTNTFGVGGLNRPSVRRPDSQYGAPNGQVTGTKNGQNGLRGGDNGFGNQGGQGFENGFGEPQDGSRFGQETPASGYGPPNIKRGFGEQDQSRGLDRNRRPGLGDQRSPSSSYGAPVGGSNLDGRNVGSPSSTYGVPQQGQNDFRDIGAGGRQDATQRGSVAGGNTPQDSYGPPPVGGGFGDERQGQSGRKPSESYGIPGTGESSGPGGGPFRFGEGENNHEPTKYEFEYDVSDASNGVSFGHSEQRDGNTATGEYNVVLPDGRKQVVEYEAGAQGFKPQIRYEGGSRVPNGRGGGSGSGSGGDGGYPRGGPVNTKPNNFGPDSLGGIGRFGEDSNSGYPVGGSRNGENGYQIRNPDQGAGYPSGGLEGEGYPSERPEQHIPGSFGGESRQNNRNQGIGRQQEGYPRAGIENGNTAARNRGGNQLGYPSGGPTGFGSGQGQDFNRQESSGRDQILGFGAGRNQAGQRRESETGTGGYPRNGPSQGRSFGETQGSKIGLGYPQSGTPFGARRSEGNQANNSQVGGNRGSNEGYPSGGPTNGPRGTGF